MTEVHVKTCERQPAETLAVVFTGDSDEARLLMDHGWINGAAMGDSRDGSGEPVLRGTINGLVVFPGDLIILNADLSAEVFVREVFDATFHLVQDHEVLTDGHATTQADVYAGSGLAQIQEQADAAAVPVEDASGAAVEEAVPAGNPANPDPTSGDTTQSDAQPVGDTSTTNADAGTSGAVSGDSVPSDAQPETASAPTDQAVQPDASPSAGEPVDPAAAATSDAPSGDAAPTA